MRPDPLMDLVLLAAIMLGAIMLFVILWLLVRKYSVGPLSEPPKEEDSPMDRPASLRRASKTSMQRAAATSTASTRRTALPAKGSEAGPSPGSKYQSLPTTYLPSTGGERPKKDDGKAAAEIAPKQGEVAAGTQKPQSSELERGEDDAGSQSKPKPSYGWVVAAVNEAPRQPSKTSTKAEDTGTTPTGSAKKSSREEETGTDAVRRASESQAGQAAREETSVVTSVERTTTRDQRRRKKKSKKQQQQRDGVGSNAGSGTASPESGCDADTTTSKRKRKSRRTKDSKPSTSAEGHVSSGLSSTEEHSQAAAFFPKPPLSTRRASTKSRTSRKSAFSEDAKSEAAACPPEGWTIGQAPADDVVAAAATAAAAATSEAAFGAHIFDDDSFLPDLPDLGAKEAEPPTPMHPNMDVFSREHSSMIAASEPAGAVLTPIVEGASGQTTPNLLSSPGAPGAVGVCDAPTPMKPNLDIFSRERSPYVPASPHKTPTPPVPPKDET